MNAERASHRNQSNLDATRDADSILVRHMTSGITDHRCAVIIHYRMQMWIVSTTVILNQGKHSGISQISYA
jgi:hypothetical protein